MGAASIIACRAIASRIRRPVWRRNRARSRCSATEGALGPRASMPRARGPMPGEPACQLLGVLARRFELRHMPDVVQLDVSPVRTRAFEPLPGRAGVEGIVAAVDRLHGAAD